MARMIPLVKDGATKTYLNTDVIVSVQARPDGRTRFNTVNGGHYYTEEGLERVIQRVNAPVQVAR